MTSQEIVKSINEKSIDELFSQYSLSNVLNPINVMYYFSKRHNIDMSTQQDANEVLGYILDDIQDKSLFELQFEQISIYNNTNKEIPDKTESKIILKENIINIEICNSIEDSIESFFKDVDETYLEEKIYSPKITLKPINSPEYLFIALKRFKYIQLAGTYIPIKIKKEIDVTDSVKYNGYLYKAISYIVHSGECGGGHYFNLKIKDESSTDSENIKKEYLMIDDDKVFAADDQQFLKIQSIGYIYLYKRIEPLNDQNTKNTVIPAVKCDTFSLAINEDEDEIGWNPIEYNDYFDEDEDDDHRIDMDFEEDI